MPNKDVKIIVLKDYTKNVIHGITGDKLAKAVLAGGHVIEAHAKINANRVFSSRATNTLAGSIQTVLADHSDTKAYCNVGPTVVYGRIQELGGWIYPVLKKLLSWIDPGTGKRVFAKKVHIPAKPYLRPAADEHQSDIVDAISYQLKDNIEKAAS